MKYLAIILLISLTFIGCDNSTAPNQLCSEKKTIIDSNLFINAAKDSFIFKKVEIVEDCLKLTIQYGGGCGDVEVNIFESGAIAKSNPPQRYIRLSFKDNDPCEALIIKDYSFDLSPIRVNNVGVIKLNLTDWDAQLEYSY